MKNRELFQFDTHQDARGQLTINSLRGGEALPFTVDRVFWITDVPAGAMRGCHAHNSCWEALVMVKGSMQVRLDDGLGWSATYQLDSPDKGLFVPPNTWCELSQFSADAVCLCMASGAYDKEGYVSDYQQFIATVRQK